VVDEETRAKEEFKRQKEEGKKKRDHEKAWESSRDARVGTWRDFMTTKSKKTKGGSAALGGLKPPKAKTNDEDKLYVQRAVGEQFRPAQAKKG
jgi:DnaJ family protein C protein 8